MEDTVFDKIIRREIPAEIVYEDEDVIAFLDLHPERPGHTLLVPKKRVRSIFDADQETFLALMRAAHRLAPKIRDAMGANGMHIALNNEPAGGQAIFHMHLHLVPASDADPIHHPLKEQMPLEKLAEIGKKLRAAIGA